MKQQLAVSSRCNYFLWPTLTVRLRFEWCTIERSVVICIRLEQCPLAIESCSFVEGPVSLGASLAQFACLPIAHKAGELILFEAALAQLHTIASSRHVAQIYWTRYNMVCAIFSEFYREALELMASAILCPLQRAISISIESCKHFFMRQVHWLCKLQSHSPTH